MFMWRINGRKAEAALRLLLPYLLVKREQAELAIQLRERITAYVRVGRSVDDFTAGFPTSWAMDPQRQPMIALGMNGVPLPVDHGWRASHSTRSRPSCASVRS